MSNSDSPTIPKEVEKEIDSALTDEDIIGAYTSGESGESEKLGLVEQWFPNSEEIHGKTNVSARQAHAIAIARNIPLVFDELPDEHGEFIREIIDDYMLLLTSVEGESRSQQMGVLQAMFGGMQDSEQEAKSFMRAAVAANASDEDND